MQLPCLRRSGGDGLDNKIIAITRAPNDAAEFCDMVRSRGGRPLALPTIRLIPQNSNVATEFINSVHNMRPDYTVFLSSRAVRILFESARKLDIESGLLDALGKTRIIAVGPKTRAILTESGIHVSYMPENHSSIGIGELFTSLYGKDARRIIIPRSAASNEFLRQLLEKIGFEVIETYLYDVQTDGQGGDWQEFYTLAAKSQIHAIIFTSASTVRAFVDIVGQKGIPLDAKLVAIGHFTSIELEHAGLTHTVSSVHTVSGALDTIMTS